MKKFSIVLLCLIFCAVPSFAASWRLISSDSGIRCSVDVDGIQRHGRYGMAWIRSIYPNGDRDYSRVVLNDQTKEFFLADMLKFNKQGQLLEKIHFSHPHLDRIDSLGVIRYVHALIWPR